MTRIMVYYLVLIWMRKFDISFDDNGNILLGKDIPNDIKDIIKDYGLDIKILNEERRKYLKYHRNLFNEKNM